MSYSKNLETLLASTSVWRFKIEELILQGESVWWRRLWVIQEVVSQSEIFVCIGDLTMPWNEFWTIFFDFAQNSGHFPEHTNRESTREWLKPIRTLVNLRSRLRTQRRGESLVALLKDTSSSSVTRPEDRVYSLLGLATEQDRRSLSVDYDRGVTDIFSDVVKTHIFETRSLEILFCGWLRGHNDTLRNFDPRIDEPDKSKISTVTKKQRSPDLPTWMPNFLEPLENKWSLMKLRMFSTSGATQPRVRFESASLFVEALSCGVALKVTTISMLGSALSGTSDSRLFGHEYLCPQAWTIAQGWNEKDDRHGLAQPTALEIILDLANNCGPRPGGDTFCFITSSGLIGLSEHPLSVGDEVVVPFGSTVPAIVRRCYDTKLDCQVHALVGACYVHGVMDGELMALYEAGKVESQEYHLR